jgi:hypothetical protein
MKSIDVVGSGYNSQKSYSHDQLMNVVKKIRIYESVSKEDIVVLNYAHTNEPDQDKRYTYSGALVKYYNKQKIIKETLDNAVEKLSQAIHVVNDILNAIASELSENKGISREIQDKLIELLTDNKHPGLNSKIIYILYKAVQIPQDYADLNNLANKLGIILTAEDNVVNRNIFKVIEDAFNKTKVLAAGAIPNLLKFAGDEHCIYKIRDNALTLLLVAAERNQNLGNVELLSNNLKSDSDPNLRSKSLKILEISEKFNAFSITLNQTVQETIIEEVEEDQVISLQSKINEDIILLSKRIISGEGQEKINGLDALSQLIRGKSGLPFVITEDICSLITDDLLEVRNRAISILDQLVSQGAIVDSGVLRNLASKLLTEKTTEDVENNIIDILSKNAEFIEFIGEYNYLKTQSNILIDHDSTNSKKQIAAKFLYEYSQNKPLPPITLESLRKGLQYSAISSWCIKALAATGEKIEFLPIEIEIITNSLNDLDQDLVSAASNVLLKSGIDDLVISSTNLKAANDHSITILETSSLNEDEQLEESSLKIRLQKYFPHLNVTGTIAGELQVKFDSLVWDDYFVDQLLLNVDINNFAELDNFLNFIRDNEIIKQQVIDCLNGKSNIHYLEQIISKQKLKELVDVDFCLLPNLLEFKDNIVKLIEHGWALKNIIKLVKSINPEDQLLFLQGLKFINEYAISGEANSLFFSFPSGSWQSELYKIAFKTEIISSSDKNQYVLLKEIASLNQDNPEILQLVDSNYLSTTITKITEVYQKDSTILSQGKPINHWQPENILSWSESLRKTSTGGEHLPEIMAVINRANYLHAGYEVRPIQIMSVLTLLNSGINGRLVQIATGEGKSTITAMLAAVHALRGEHVDVITSSPILARRDNEEKGKFYKILGLSSADNTDVGIDKVAKPCYKANIVYGDVSNYQFDLLKTEYKKYGTRGDRPFGIAIVDEVDSMLVDEGGKIAKLSSPIFGMEYLEPLLVAAWQQLGLIQSKYTYLSSANQLLWIDGEFSNKNDELLLLKGTSEDDVHIIDDAEKFTSKLLEDYINSLLQQQAVLIPNHLVEFASAQAKFWARSAVSAMNMEENRNYIIVNESDGSKTIAPVAYDSTGITQEKTQWGNGLHQFLQIKHGLKIKAEGLTGCFISNMGYFQRYVNKIYGMTGTLGSVSSKELLQNTYKVDLGFIPTYRPKKFLELAGIIKDGRDEWLNEITSNITREAKNGRACLVISETIADSMDIERSLKLIDFPSSKIISYYRSDNFSQAEVLNSKLEPGSIIVATNLAGRGTDIKTTEQLENNGGLHVCLTFLPANLRVEEQAFGRTSRQGNIGTGQLIINSDYERVKLQKAYPDYKSVAQTLEQFKEWRDLAEVARIEDIKSNKVHKLKLEDELFEQFKQLAHHLSQTENNKYKLQQLEELWGLWFKNISNEEKYSSGFASKTKTDFISFSDKIVKLYTGGNQIMANPVYLTHQAFNKMGEYGSYQEAIDLFTQSTNLDDKFSFAAHYNLAYAILRQTGSNKTPNPEGSARAAEHLLTARNQIAGNIIPAWQSMKIMLSPEHNGSPLCSQIHSKLDLMQMQINYIDNALEVISSSGSDKIIKVKDPKLFDDFYPFEVAPKEEILELNLAGVLRLYEVEAVSPPKYWATNIAITLLGIAQVVVGIAFSYATAGLGAKLSAAMIAEGIKDIYSAVKATMRGEVLDFGDYWTDKGISYAITMVVIGVDSIKNTANATRTTATEGTKQALKEGSKKTTQEILKQKLVDVGKQAVMTIIEQEASLALARGISGYLSDFRNSVKKDALQEVQNILEQPHIAKALSYIIAVDRFCGDNENQKLLMQRLEAALKPREQELFNISKRLANSLSGHSPTLSLLSNAIEIGGYAKAIDDFNTLLEKFCTELSRAVLEINEQLPTTHSLLSMKLRIDHTSAQEIVNQLQQAGIMTGERSFDEQLIGFTPGIVTTSTISNSNIHSSEVRQVSLQHSHEVMELTGEQIGVGKSNIIPFQFRDLKEPQVETCPLDKIDFGVSYSGARRQIAISCIRDLHAAYSSEYTQERTKLAEHLGQSAGSSMVRKLQTGLIQPASTVIASTGIKKIGAILAEHNKKARLALLKEQTRTITINEEGVISSSENAREFVSEKSLDSRYQTEKLEKIKVRDIERQLADQYPGLTRLEQKKLAIEVYSLEQQWQQDPFLRPGIQIASSGGITSDVPLLIMPSTQSQAISIVMNRYENSTSILSARGGELIGVVDNSRLLNQPDINILIGTSSKTSIRSRQDIHHNVNVDMDGINLRLGEIFFTKLADESTGVKKDWALNTVKAIRQVQINRTQSLPLRQDFTNESARNFSIGRTSWKGMVFDYMGNEIRWGEGVVSNVSAKNLPLTTSMVKGSFATAGQYL